METLLWEIENLKKEKNAVVLAHYYVDEEVQKAADYVGDSYYLAKKAKSCDADTIVFCGVAFMGESAKILNPAKTVLMPDAAADCPMAHMVTKEKILEMREKYDDLAVVCYINSTAETKCLSDVCVTSSNALKIVSALPNKNIFFVPDGNLGAYVKEKVKDKSVILNDGYCPIHHFFDAGEVERLKSEHPSAKVLAHPECRREVLDKADYIGSTSGIIAYTSESKNNEFIICTERGVLGELRKNNPEKHFYFADKGRVCEDMKLNTLEKLRDALKFNRYTVEVDEEIRKGALKPLDRMLEMAQ